MAERPNINNTQQDPLKNADNLRAREQDQLKAGIDISKKTTGEKYYGRLKFMTGEGFILALTAVFAYIANHGKSSYMGVPNGLQKLQNWIKNDLTVKKIPMQKMGRVGQLLAGSFASMIVTSWGGNFFAPVMKGFESVKHSLVDHFNQHYGKPGELEAGRERLSKEPKQTWGDVIKGRIASYGIVWAAFFSAMLLSGQKDGVERFDRYEDWFGKKLAGFTKDGGKIANTPILERLHNPKATNKAYKFGRILALDIFATTAALVVWNIMNKFMAKKRTGTEDNLEIVSNMSGLTFPAAVLSETPDLAVQQQSFSDRVQPRAKINITPSALTHVDAVETSRHAETVSSPSV